MPIRTTAGQFLINEALPEPLRDYGRVLDKGGIQTLMRQLAETYPDQYRDVSKRLADIGREISTQTGGNSFGLAHMKKSAAGRKIQTELQGKIQKILDAETWGGRPLDDERRHQLIVRTVGDVMGRQQEEVFKEALAAKNPLAVQLIGAGRGNKMNLSSMLGSDLLYSDHHDNVIPLPVLRSYSQGLSPAEYWAGTYGARRGVMATKFATQDAGFLSKQLNQVSHRLVVEGDDEEDERDENGKPIDRGVRGVPMDTDDMDNEGALLGHPVTDKDGTVLYKRNTVLTPKILKHLSAIGKKRILVRSPMVGGSPNGGVYARDVGVREKGVIPGRGEMVGLTAAQALSEPISQGQLSAKHSGGVAGQEKAVSGFQAIDQQIQVPKTFKGGAAHTEEDGVVQRVEPAPQGGQYVYVNDKPHYVSHGFKLLVKKGDTVEAGDVISEGAPNPAIIVEHKGVGEGRRYFVKSFKEALASAGVKGHRRNIELLARGLINHVRLTDEMGDHVPDDVVPYSTLERTWKPRDGASTTQPRDALGRFMEKPALHYTVGTKIRPSVLRDLEEFGVKEVTSHAEPPPFQSEMIRGMYSLKHDPDPLTRMYGSGLKGSLLDSVHRGGTSNELGSSFVPALSRAVDFGRKGVIRQPAPGSRPPTEDKAEFKVPMPQAPETLAASPTPEPLSVAATPQPAKPASRWGSLFKLSADVARVRELVKQAQGPAQPAAPAAAAGGTPASSPLPKAPTLTGGNTIAAGGGPAPRAGGVSPANPGTAGTAAGKATTAGIAATAARQQTPVTPLQGQAVNNQFAMTSGYQGGTNILTNQHARQAFAGGDMTGIDPHAMATLMGWNTVGGYTKNPSAYTIDQRQPQFAPGAGMPGMGGFGGDYDFVGGGGGEQAAGGGFGRRALEWLQAKDGRRMTFGGDALNAALGYNPAGVAFNAAIDGYEVFDRAREGYRRDGWTGAESAVAQRGAEKADTTNQYLFRPFQTGSVEDTLHTVGHVAAKPLHVVDNLNTIYTGARESALAAGDVASGMRRESEQVGKDYAAAARSPHMATPMEQANAKTRDVERAYRDANNPYDYAGAAATAAISLPYVKGVAEQENAKNFAMTAAWGADRAKKMETYNGVNHRYFEALKNGHPPSIPWIDPQTNIPWSPGLRREVDEWNAKGQFETTFDRQTKGMGTADKVTQDVASLRPAVVGFEEAVIPGTNTTIKRFATPGEIWRGEFSLNPFGRRR